jgi:hypothetical protein
VEGTELDRVVDRELETKSPQASPRGLFQFASFRLSPPLGHRALVSSDILQNRSMVGFSSIQQDHHSEPYLARCKGDLKMNNYIFWSLAAILGACAPECAAQESGPRKCDLDTLRGTYVLTISGTRPAPRVLPGLSGTPGTIEAVTGVFLQVFDGKGKFYLEDPVTVKGALSGLFPDQPGTGTYEVNANCTGSFSVNLPQLPAPLENHFVVFDKGKRFRAVVVSPQPLMISVEGERIN